MADSAKVRADLGLRNLARGPEKYQKIRWRVFQEIRGSSRPISRLSSFLSQRLFKLDRSWVNMTFTNADRRAILTALYSETEPMRTSSGHQAARRFLEMESNEVLVSIGSILTESVADDRLVFKRVQWRLEELQSQVNLAEWLRVTRREISINPDYLTGISWQWLDRFIAQFRIKPFLGNPDSIYLFLLRLIELREIESTKLRTVVASFSANRSFEQFITWLLEEFSLDAAAFLRYFLTPEVILHLEFTDNYKEQTSVAREASRLAGQTVSLRIQMVPAASGSSVVAHEELTSRIRNLNEAIAAIDMESYGFYYACNFTLVAKPEMLCIKSACDFADQTKNDEWHLACSYLSAQAIRDVLLYRWNF